MRRDTQRTHNLEMAAATLDGQVIKPGEEFSFNEHVGPRVPEKGYMEAAGGPQETAWFWEWAAGSARSPARSSTRSLSAGLPIVKRSSHSLPSTYVPLGRDATVVYDAVDFVFANDTGRPVLIAASIIGSRLTIAVVGHRDIKPMVKTGVEVKERFPLKRWWRTIPALAAGVQAVTQEGRDGYKVQLWRTIDLARSAAPFANRSAGGFYYPPVKKDRQTRHRVPAFRQLGSPSAGTAVAPILRP